MSAECLRLREPGDVGPVCGCPDGVCSLKVGAHRTGSLACGACGQLLALVTSPSASIWRCLACEDDVAVLLPRVDPTTNRIEALPGMRFLIRET